MNSSKDQIASTETSSYVPDEPSLLENIWESTHISCVSTESICGPFFLDPENEKKTLANATSAMQSIQNNNIDPFNHNMVGPKCCEYCGSSSTRLCNSSEAIIDSQTGRMLPICTRPTLFFLKKRPPFDDGDEKWDPTTEYLK